MRGRNKAKLIAKLKRKRRIYGITVWSEDITSSRLKIFTSVNIFSLAGDCDALAENAFCARKLVVTKIL